MGLLASGCLSVMLSVLPPPAEFRSDRTATTPRSSDVSSIDDHHDHGTSHHNEIGTVLGKDVASLRVEARSLVGYMVL